MMEKDDLMDVFDGFWLPKELRQKLITPDTAWKVQYQKDGQPANAGDPGAVGARWPVFSRSDWELLFRSLEERRRTISPDFMHRMQNAVTALLQRFADAKDPLTNTVVQFFSTYSGYSPEMINFALDLMDLTPFDSLEKSLSLQIPLSVQREYVSLQTIGRLDGRLRRFTNRKIDWPFALKWKKTSPLPSKENYPHTVLGYAAGNVIGTAFLIALLGQVSALANPHKGKNDPKSVPSVLVKNSRQEPLFSSFFFTALEEIDPDLVRTVAVMIWDYEDEPLQDYLVSQADLIIAAAADFTIEQIDETRKRANPAARFHKHGHKVSFTTIGKSYLARGSSTEVGGSSEMVEMLTLLSALDSMFWDQYGCLSSRVHFVEQGSDEYYSPLEYGHLLVAKLRVLSKRLPRGAIPMSRIHDRFDYFNAQTFSDQVKLCSSYDDDFIVVLDERPWNPQHFKTIVNNCIERTIVVRPVASIMEVPEVYLKWIEPGNLQTMYTAIDGREHNRWSKNLTQFLEAVGMCGVTGVRTVGRSPFAQLAYSWDGLLPQELSFSYPSGYFTTVEFENTFFQIMGNYATLTDKGL